MSVYSAQRQLRRCTCQNTLWKRVLACVERALRVLGEAIGVTPQQLMATISGNDKEMVKILVMAEALEKWDEARGQIA